MDGYALRDAPYSHDRDKECHPIPRLAPKSEAVLRD